MLVVGVLLPDSLEIRFPDLMDPLLLVFMVIVGASLASDGWGSEIGYSLTRLLPAQVDE